MSKKNKPAQQAVAAAPTNNNALMFAALAVAVVFVMAFAWMQTNKANATAGVAATVVDGVQIAEITSLPQFSPTQITLKAGIPSQLKVGAGQGCTAAFIIPSLNVKRDLTNGGALVDLPALQPGEYEFTCQMGHRGGALVVQ